MKRTNWVGRAIKSGGVATVAGALLLSSTPSFAATASPVTITVWTGSWDSPNQPNASGAGWEALTKHYEALHPNVKIAWSSYPAGEDPSSYQKLLTAVAGGNGPNIALINRFEVKEFAYKGALEPINNSAKDALMAVEKRVPGALQDLLDTNGQMYGVPVIFDSVGYWSLFYNKTLFARAGIKTPPRSWSEAVSDASKLTIMKNGKIVQLGYEPYGDPAGEFNSLLYSEQGMPISPDGKTAELTSPLVQKAVVQQVKLVQADGGYKKVLAFMPPASAPPNLDPFLQGQSAMYDMGDWENGTIAVYKPHLNYGVAFLPTPTGTQPTSWVAGWSFQLTKNAANPQKSSDLIQYLGSQDAALTFIKAAQAYGATHHNIVYLPGELYFAYPNLVAKYNLPTLKSLPNVQQAVQHFISAGHTAYKSYSLAGGFAPGELWQAEQTAAENVLYGKMTIQQSLQQQNQIVQTAINNLLSSQ